MPELKEFELIKFDSPYLHYLHPHSTPTSPAPAPAPPKISDDGKRGVLITAPGSDWWHTPERDSQDGLAWGKWVGLDNGGFEVRVKASIDHQKRVDIHPGLIDSDQACLFVYISQHVWIKAGVEFDMGKLWDGAVVCNPYSDWAITPSTPDSVFTISYHPAKRHLRIFLNDEMIREVNSFAHIPGYTPTQKEDFGDFDLSKDGGGGDKVFIGVMAASPLGGGCEAVFQDLEYRQGVRPVV